jgi:hypothetical protein
VKQPWVQGMTVARPKSLSSLGLGWHSLALEGAVVMHVDACVRVATACIFASGAASFIR